MNEMYIGLRLYETDKKIIDYIDSLEGNINEKIKFLMLQELRKSSADDSLFLKAMPKDKKLVRRYSIRIYSDKDKELLDYINQYNKYYSRWYSSYIRYVLERNIEI